MGFLVGVRAYAGLSRKELPMYRKIFSYRRRRFFCLCACAALVRNRNGDGGWLNFKPASGLAMVIALRIAGVKENIFKSASVVSFTYYLCVLTGVYPTFCNRGGAGIYEVL